MRNLLLVSATAILLGSVASGPVSAGCGKHGTEVAFVDTPSDAATQAKKEQKLVFVLHLSGHFDDPGLT
jgi:hypothetical protein